ncbi:MAG TPA: NAD(P)-binding domain-containing protein [Bacteroidales bacterium]|nr:NAD(P)-binding domain-containing protein [Bacteroidales bacterium]
MTERGPGLKAGVLGGGSWGTALVKVLQHHHNEVHWWVRRPAQLEAIRKGGFNPDYLSYTHFDNRNLHLSTSLEEVVSRSDVVFLAIPSAFLPEVFHTGNRTLLAGRTVISAVKGLEPTSLKPVYVWLEEEMGVSRNNLGVIGGPCHSEEVAMQRLSFLTLGVFDKALGEKVAGMLETPFLKVLLSDDVLGISVAAVLKNIYGILAGTAYGLRFGDNFLAVMVSNALLEMDRVLADITGTTRSIQNSVYAGDLMVTSYSGFSRNWMLGNLIGKGYPVKAALLEIRMVAEGYYATGVLKSVPGFSAGKYPLLDAAYALLYDGIPPEQIFRELSSRLR